MSKLRPSLADIVAKGHESAPYFSALLSSKSGLQIIVDNREERIAEGPPTAGTVLSAYDGATFYERAVSGFGKNDVEKAASKLVEGTSFEKTVELWISRNRALLATISNPLIHGPFKSGCADLNRRPHRHFAGNGHRIYARGYLSGGGSKSALRMTAKGNAG